MGNKDNTLNFEKITLDINENNSKETNEKDIAIFATFIGGKIKILKEIFMSGTEFEYKIKIYCNKLVTQMI